MLNKERRTHSIQPTTASVTHTHDLLANHIKT